ncbi:hypothetical protein D3C78_1089940 [compost metagenome]
MRIDADPGIHLTLLKRVETFRMLQVHDLEVVDGQLVLVKRADEGEIGRGALGHRNGLALEIGDGLDRRVRAHLNDGGTAPARHIDHLQRHAVGAGEKG